MSKVIEDLFVKVQIERIRLRTNKNHPTDINALTKGVFTGLNLGLNYVEARNTGTGEMVLAFLAGGSHNSLATNLEMANEAMPENKLFTAEMFVGLHYRTNEPHHFYEKGMSWGFRYVQNLYLAFLDPSSEVVARRMTADHVKNVVKMLEHL